MRKLLPFVVVCLSATLNALSQCTTAPLNRDVLPYNSNAYLRIRITPAAMSINTPTGYCSNGEGEDYSVGVPDTPLPGYSTQRYWSIKAIINKTLCR